MNFNEYSLVIRIMAESAYNAYALNWLNTPTWCSLSEDIKAGWCAATDDIRDALINKLVDE